MSLLRVKHTLSPTLEKSLVVLVLAYGVFAIYLASIKPLVVLTTASIGTVREDISLDTDSWDRARNDTHRYIFAIPDGWVFDATDPDSVILASGEGYLLNGKGDRITIDLQPLGERNQIENIAVSELVGERPALYDVGVHGKIGLFAVTFKNKRIAEQTVYVDLDEKVMIIRGGSLDPAAFSAFISTIKFLPTN